MKGIGIALLAMAALRVGMAEGCAGAEPQIKAVNKSLARNQITAVEGLLAALSTAYPDCTQTLLLQARTKAARGDAAEARTLFSRYLAVVPDDASGLAYFAAFLIGQAEYQRADDLSASALEHGPSNAAALAVRGQILEMKREPKIGLTLLERACELDPGDANTQFQLGALYDRAKRPIDATKQFEKVVLLDPSFASAWDYLALNLEALGEVERADSAYRSGLAVDREGPRYDAFLDYNYGRFLAKRNQLMESKQHLNLAVQAVPDFRAPWYDRAKVNLRMGNLREARTDAEKAASITDRTGGIIDLQIFTLLEQIYRRLGETALAERYAAQTRATPPPVRKGYEQTSP